MELQICKDEKSWVLAAHAWLDQRIRKFKPQRLFIPAGSTPRPLYRFWEAENPSYLHGLTLVQLDEILTGAKCGEFRNFFVETLPHYAGQIELIDTAEGGAELALLGLGLNGHVAFHEPGLAREFFSGCLNLNAETARRLDVAPDTRVVTYGVGAFMRSHGILLMIRGEEKKDILRQVLAPDSTLPASYLKNHPDLTILTDFEF